MSCHKTPENKLKEKKRSNSFTTAVDNKATIEIICHCSDNESDNNDSTIKSVICLKCGGEVEENEDTDILPRGFMKNSEDKDTQESLSVKNNKIKSITSSQRYGIGLTDTFRCTCSQNSDDDDDVHDNRKRKSNAPCSDEDAPAKNADGSVVVCRKCGGVRDSKEDNKTNICAKTNSDVNMNEAIMAKREAVWGNNIPPEFIIRGTLYADRHEDCCIDKESQNSKVSYKCPKSNNNVEPTKNADYKLMNALSNFSIECVIVGDKLPQKSGQTKEQTEGDNKKAQEDVNIVCKLRESSKSGKQQQQLKPKQNVNVSANNDRYRQKVKCSVPGLNKKFKDDSVSSRTSTINDSEDFSDETTCENESDYETDTCSCRIKRKVRKTRSWYDKGNKTARTQTDCKEKLNETTSSDKQINGKQLSVESDWLKAVVSCVLSMAQEQERDRNLQPAKDANCNVNEMESPNVDKKEQQTKNTQTEQQNAEVLAMPSALHTTTMLQEPTNDCNMEIQKPVSAHKQVQTSNNSLETDTLNSRIKRLSNSKKQNSEDLSCDLRLEDQSGLKVEPVKEAAELLDERDDEPPTDSSKLEEQNSEITSCACSNDESNLEYPDETTEETQNSKMSKGKPDLIDLVDDSLKDPNSITRSSINEKSEENSNNCVHCPYCNGLIQKLPSLDENAKGEKNEPDSDNNKSTQTSISKRKSE